jgi:hypothetical protein
MAESNSRASSTVAGFYAPNGDKQHMVEVVAIAELFLSPGAEIGNAFREVPNDELTVSGVHEVSTGKQGGIVKCGSGEVKASGLLVPVAMCVWADHGSMGLGIFFNRSVEESAPIFVTIRSQVEHHA